MNPKLFFWNIHGLNDQNKHVPFANWLSTNQPLLGAILEIHIKKPNLNQVMLAACSGSRFTSNHNTNEGGRIIVIWKDPFMVKVLHQSRQSLTCSVVLPGGSCFTYTAIYASNFREERVTLWKDLLEIQQTLFLEKSNWIIGGDLNQILHFSENSNPSVDHLTDDMTEMRDVMLNLGLKDMRFQGCYHTWTNKKPDDPKTKKPDRAMVNEKWITTYPDSVATFFPFDISDHTPFLINLVVPLPSSGTKPFKF